MVNSNYSALPLTTTAIELQSAQPPPPPKSGASANGHAKLTKQDSFLGEVEDDDATPGEHDELPLIGDEGPAGPPEGSGVSGAVFNLATSIIGAGIMALPATMKVLGVAVGLVSILVMGVLSEVTASGQGARPPRQRRGAAVHRHQQRRDPRRVPHHHRGRHVRVAQAHGRHGPAHRPRRVGQPEAARLVCSCGVSRPVVRAREDRLAEPVVRRVGRARRRLCGRLVHDRGGEARRGQARRAEDGAGFQLEGGGAGPARGDTDHDQRLHLPFQCTADLQRAQGEDTSQHVQRQSDLHGALCRRVRADRHLGVPPVRRRHGVRRAHQLRQGPWDQVQHGAQLHCEDRVHRPPGPRLPGSPLLAEADRGLAGLRRARAPQQEEDALIDSGDPGPHLPRLDHDTQHLDGLQVHRGDDGAGVGFHVPGPRGAEAGQGGGVPGARREAPVDRDAGAGHRRQRRRGRGERVQPEEQV